MNEVKGEIPNITNLAKTAALNSKINEVKGKIPSTINLGSTTVLTAVENKIPDISSLVKKLTITQEIAALVNKTDFDDKLKKLNKKVSSNKLKHLRVENKFKKLQTFDSSIFIGQIYLFDNGAQLYNTEENVSWKSKGFFD